ncbi:flagellar biosynthetic protein FliR [Vibrio parahaemolyticus]|uniref:Flagellar biosynthetic protein FliR n=1 Tax=Vibrio parahaemolyticus TaxID=670 RepID=A0AAW8PX87_VIBPH|nr:flagellar biosynthetic protein FliR [Vibrio parahaemolyticus]EGR2229460.1 type III secretion protein [Vibrio parahaemolyticus]MDS1820857.1 flagellar biosynthetic protein FliR [Vibrio parahaemolyticus]
MENALIPALIADHSVAFQLVLFRLVAFCSIIPYMGTKNVPRKVALFFAIAFAFVITPRLVQINPIDPSSIDIPLEVFSNMVVGFLYGGSLLLVFEMIAIAGVVIAYASGLGMAQMIDPASGGNSGVITNLLNVVFGMVFISSGGLLLFIEFFSGSFESFPLVGIKFENISFLLVAQEFGRVFLMGVMIAIPFTGAALLLNTALAVVSKSAPAMNLFTIGFPLSVLLGIMALSLTLPTLVADIYTYVLTLSESYQSLL